MGVLVVLCNSNYNCTQMPEVVACSTQIPSPGTLRLLVIFGVLPISKLSPHYSSDFMFISNYPSKVHLSLCIEEIFTHPVFILLMIYFFWSLFSYFHVHLFIIMALIIPYYKFSSALFLLAP